MKRVLVPVLLLVAACNNNDSPKREAGGPELGPPDDLYVANDSTKYDVHVCGEAEFNIARTIPDMLIVLDRSNSMSQGTTPLWNSCRNAIYDITSAMDTRIWFGLSVFPSSVGFLTCDPASASTMCYAPADPVVGVATATSGAIKSALTPMAVCGGTPTAPTLVAVKQYLQTKLAPNGHPKYILLATDGGPNCNLALNPATCTCAAPGQCSGDGQNCLDDVATLKALDDLCAAGIKTYVVGLGAAQTLTTMLQTMAQHGCTQQPFTPTDPAAIQKAFADISSAVASCSYEVDCAKIQDPGLVNFYFDGKVVPRTTSHTGGWDWTTACKGQTGKGAVEFYGAECIAIKAGTVKAIAAKFGCKTIE